MKQDCHKRNYPKQTNHTNCNTIQMKKKVKARKRRSNSCACYTLQGSSAKLGATEEAYMAGKYIIVLL